MGLTSKQKLMVGVMLFGAFLVVLNQTLLSPALPSIMRDFGVDAPTVQWLMSGYALVEAVIIPLSAFLLGRFSVRRLFIGGFVLFAIGTLLCAWGPVFGVVMLGRVLQATSTGVVMPMVITVILLVFPREKRGAAMGLVGLLIGFAPAVGPAVSGVLVDTVGWHFLFVIVAALSLLVLLLGVFALQNYGEFERTSLDIASVVLSSVGLFCLLYGLSSFASAPSPLVPALLIVVGVVILALFVRRQLHLEHPMLQVTVLKTRQYRTAVICIVVFQAILIGLANLLPLFIQNVCGYSATLSGFIVLPGAIVGALMSMFSGRLFDKHGVRGLVLSGCAGTVVGAILLVLLPPSVEALYIAGANVVLIMGLQAAMTPLNTWGVNSLDNRVIQHANALSNTLNQVAASFGTALLVSVSAMGALAAPTAAAPEQLYMGYRLAFAAVLILALCLLVIALAFVRERKGASVPRLLEEDDLLVMHAMNPQVACVPNTATVRQALLEIARADTSGIPVVDPQRHVVGFISDGDIMGYLGRDNKSVDTALLMYRYVDDEKLQHRLVGLLDKNVMELATKRVISVESTMGLEDACHVLADRRIKKVPVVDDGKLVGALSRRNIIHGVVANLPAEA